MKRLYLTTKLPITVPSSVIDALWGMHHRFEKEYGNYEMTKNGKDDSVILSDLQIPKNKKLLDNNIPNGHMLLETMKHRTEWLFYDKNVQVVEKFINEHFSSAFQFRIDILPARKKLGWHNRHPYPRVFIPMHENGCHFRIKRMTTEFHDNIYKLGECWMWDVREYHEVDNTESDVDRVMALFNIDPAIETNEDLFYHE